jgi:hypothetical protein
LRHHPLEPLGQAFDLDIIRDTVPERARLADIEHVAARILHPVDAGADRQRVEHVADRRDARRKIGRLAATADGEGGFVFVETVGGIGGGHRWGI